MTDDIRNLSDQTKFAYLSHLDIYRDQGSVFTMPGYVAENGFDSDTEGVKVHDLRAFYFTSAATIYAVGTKADGTGSKLFQRDFGETEWKVPTFSEYQVEPDKDLAARPFLLGPQQIGAAELYYPIINGTALIGSGGNRTNVVRQGPNVSSPNWEEWRELANFNTTGQLLTEQGFNGDWYVYPRSPQSGGSGIGRITSSDLTTIKTTNLGPSTVKSGDYQVGFAGTQSGAEQQSRLVLWDSVSQLADQNISLGSGVSAILGYPSNLWSIVMAEYTGPQNANAVRGNGSPAMSIKLISGETPETIYRIFMPTNTGSIVEPIFNGVYRDAMAWYARIPTNSAGTEFREGIWAFGRGDINSQMGTSVLLNTESLGRVETTHFFGLQPWFCHNEDGSVSRLDNFETGTYDVPATIETLVYGAQSPYLKQFEGMTINTSSLPAGGEVTVEYRVDRNTAWQPLATSDTEGTQRHSFTGTAGESIGRFQEIQFRITLLGKLELTNIFLEITETDDLPH